MTPEYLEELADLADPDKLWKLSGWSKEKLTIEQKKHVDMGVALRRHAHHVRQLMALLKEGKSLLITPLSPNGNAIKAVDTPSEHQRLRRIETPNDKLRMRHKEPSSPAAEGSPSGARG